MGEPELLTVEDAARAMQIGRSTLYEWINDGLVPTFRVRGVIRIPRAALLAMINEQVQTSTATDEGRRSAAQRERSLDR